MSFPRASVFISAGVAAIAGFGGTLAIIVAAMRSVGADAPQTSSAVTMLCLAMAGTSALLSTRYRMPIVTAWSTPGAALIAASAGAYDIHRACGAFLVAAGLMLVTAAFRPVAALVGRIPASVASAMLAGIVLRFALAIFENAQATPGLVLPLLAVFLLVRLVSPVWAVLAVLVAGLALSLALGLDGALTAPFALSGVTFVAPAFEPAAIVGLGAPLYLVTMASQNLPGFAVLRADGYQPPVQAILASTGAASFVIALFGAPNMNLAAISAAICTGPSVDPDPARRWPTGLVYAAFYVVFAAFGASLVTLFAALAPALIATVAGVALFGALVGALTGALSDERRRFAAVATFVVTASGLTFAGVGAAFWGLLAGIAVLALDALAARRKAGTA